MSVNTGTGAGRGERAAQGAARSTTGRTVALVWVLAAPAFVAVWSGWVGLGGLTGFGLVQPLPGIWDGLWIDSRVLLPIGVEAYAALALRAWLAPSTPVRARTFARRSAITALILGAGGQVAYHLMSAAGITVAPWPITALVACLPVAVLGMGAALAHMLHTHPADVDVDERDLQGVELDAVHPADVADQANTAVPADRPGLDPSDRTDRTDKTLNAQVNPGVIRQEAARTRSDRTDKTPADARPASGSSIRALVLALVGEHPGWTQAQVADAAGCSVRTVRRHLNGPTTTTTEPAVSSSPVVQLDDEREAA